MKYEGGRWAIIIGGLLLMPASLVIPDLYYSIRWILFCLGIAMAIIPIISLDYKPKIIQSNDGPFPLPVATEEAEKLKKLAFFFDDTDAVRAQLGQQIRRLKSEIENDVTVAAIGYLSVHEGFHNKYLEHRNHLDRELGKKVESLWNACKKFNGDLTDQKQRSQGNPSRSGMLVIALENRRFIQEIESLALALEEINMEDRR
jgi:hypothetical protein